MNQFCSSQKYKYITLQWPYVRVSTGLQRDCLSSVSRLTTKGTSKLHNTDICVENQPVTHGIFQSLAKRSPIFAIAITKIADKLLLLHLLNIYWRCLGLYFRLLRVVQFRCGIEHGEANHILTIYTKRRSVLPPWWKSSSRGDCHCTLSPQGENTCKIPICVPLGNKPNTNSVWS